jgi:catechol 2,3-dioxygenase-like lactoylglutathione lyase family enzyme
MATGTMLTLAKETQMQLNRLDHVNVKTANLDQMIKWYEDVLGMKSGARPPFPFPGAWMYAGDYPVVHLVGVDSQPAGQDPTLEHFALSATGYASFLENLDRRNIDYRVGKVPGIDVTQVNVFDVDGNHIHIDFQNHET